MSYTITQTTATSNPEVQQLKAGGWVVKPSTHSQSNLLRRDLLKASEDFVKLANKPKCRDIFNEIKKSKTPEQDQKKISEYGKELSKKLLKETWNKYLPSTPLTEEQLQAFLIFHEEAENTVSSMLDDFVFAIFFTEQGWPWPTILGTIKYYSQSTYSLHERFLIGGLFQSEQLTSLFKSDANRKLDTKLTFVAGQDADTAVVTMRSNGGAVLLIQDRNVSVEIKERGKVCGEIATKLVLDPEKGFVFKEFTTDNFLFYKIVLEGDVNLASKYGAQLLRYSKLQDDHNKARQQFAQEIGTYATSDNAKKCITNHVEKLGNLSDSFFFRGSFSMDEYAKFHKQIKDRISSLYKEMEEKNQIIIQPYCEKYLRQHTHFRIYQLQDTFASLSGLEPKDRALVDEMVRKLDDLFTETDHNNLTPESHKNFCKQYHNILNETYDKLSGPLVAFRKVMTVALNLLVSLTGVELVVQVAKGKFFLFAKPQPKNEDVKDALKGAKHCLKIGEAEKLPSMTMAK